MPSPQLSAQLERAFATSKSFLAMTPQDQAQIRALYTNASDEEIMNALKVMQQEKLFSDELDVKEAKINADKIQIVAELKLAMKKAERLNLRDDEAVEAQSTDKEADALLKGIGADKDKKRKKLFGIF